MAQALAPQTSTAALRALIYRHGNRAVCDGIALAWARHDATNSRGILEAGSASTHAFASMLATAVAWSAPALPITGGDVIARGISPGPRVGAIVKDFERWWITAGFPREQEQIKQKLAELIVVTNR